MTPPAVPPALDPVLKTNDPASCMAAAPIPTDTGPLAPSDPAAETMYTAPLLLSDPAPTTSGHQAQVAAGSLAAGPAPNVDGTSHVCGLCRPGLQCELRACCTTDCHSHRPSLRCPRPSPMLQPHCSRTLHRCQHSWKLRWTQTHHRCCRPAPRQMPTPIELHRSCCQCRQLLKTESVIHHRHPKPGRGRILP